MKKIISLILAATLLAGNLSLSASAKPAAAAQASVIPSGLLDYFVGSVAHTGTIARTNAAVEKMVTANAGKGFSVSASWVLDKNFMVPHSQQYYQPDVQGGICNKAAAMMILSFYRDGKEYTNLPDDATMYKEISAMYTEITKAFSAFFTNPILNNQFDTSQSYEMLGTFEMGVAYYLYSKGYTQAAQQVIDNISCSIILVPGKAGNSVLKVLMAYFSTWISKQTNGALTLSTNIKTKSNDVIIHSIKKGEPVIIGCLTALGNDIYSVHYFVGVGYYKTGYAVKVLNKTYFAFSREYLEVYDTWGTNSSVINWTIFKNTALFSSISLADV